MSRVTPCCVACGTGQGPAAMRCTECGGEIGFRYGDGAREPDGGQGNTMWRWWRRLPVAGPERAVTLGEGGTPLLRARDGEVPRLFLKDETRNPTGSHKDRALAMAVTHARSLGHRLSVVVSAGSTGISNSAFAARAGMRSIVLVPRGTAEWRLLPLYALGATVVEVQEPIDTVTARVTELAAGGRIYSSSTTRTSNPYQAEAPKTIAYEIFEALGDVPDWVVLPIGGGGTISGVWRGFEELRAAGETDRSPRLLGVVARDYNALERAMDAGVEDPDATIEEGYSPPPTLLVKIEHVFPPDGREALAAVRSSGGAIRSVTDEQAVAAVRRFGAREGLLVEPSSSAALAGLEAAVADGTIDTGATVVAILTGSGFRERLEAVVTGERATISLDELPQTLSAYAQEVPEAAPATNSRTA
jgi:threonine synthase